MAPGKSGRIMLELIVYLLQFIAYLINLYTYIVIAVVIFSWLMAFGVINAYNPIVRSIWQALNAVTEPLLGPIRNAMPNLGGLDISPVILLLACYFVQGLILNVLIPKLAVALS
jgi:YggT family protein